MGNAQQEAQLLRAAASAQQLHAIMAGVRAHLAGQVQRELLALYYCDQDEPVLDERETARKIAEASVMHADALIAALSGTRSQMDHVVGATR